MGDTGVLVARGGARERSPEIAAARSLDVARPDVSVVVPSLNEAPTLADLARGIAAALDGRATHEIVLVDDGSTDGSWKIIAELHAADARIKGVRMRKNFGKAAALTAGFRRASGAIVVTMDADMQDDPRDLPVFLAKVNDGADVVVGWKVERRDPVGRRVLSRIFNLASRVATGVSLHDMNCGFKAYRREVVEAVPIYGDLFRFAPALAAHEGFRIEEVAVTHHPRKHGESRYGMERVLRGFFDLVSVVFLTRYSKKPMHFFGLIGLTLATIGVLIDGYLTVLWFQGYKIGDRPLLLLGVLLILVGLQLFSTGVIGELLVYQRHKRMPVDERPVREELL